MLSIIKKYKKLQNATNIWILMAQALPTMALLCLGIFYIMDWSSAETIAWILIALISGLVSITWWWWVIYAVKDIHGMIETTNQTFDEIVNDIKLLKVDMKKLHSSTLKLNKSQSKITKADKSK